MAQSLLAISMIRSLYARDWHDSSSPRTNPLLSELGIPVIPINVLYRSNTAAVLSMPYLEVLDLERFRLILKSWFHSRQNYAQLNSMGLSFRSVGVSL
ncbi:UNVERIFIED_CONTAM: hypothetical protein Sradi_6439000 [Sesamum radiatum]|uniref:Uncharacterized protein n=1 Tax=Sesamum radiatum TaxID=300843 RepID=A0AAW2K4B6_SESRA